MKKPDMVLLTFKKQRTPYGAGNTTRPTGYATIVYPRTLVVSQSIHEMPECVKYEDQRNAPDRFYPLMLRKHTGKRYIYHPFRSKTGFFSFDGPKEAQDFLKKRGYTLVHYADFSIEG